MAPIAGFDPNLAARTQGVDQSGQGANAMKQEPEEKANYDLNPVRHEPKKKEESKDFDSPIDDEPEGTF